MYKHERNKNESFRYRTRDSVIRERYDVKNIVTTKETGMRRWLDPIDKIDVNTVST